MKIFGIVLLLTLSLAVFMLRNKGRVIYSRLIDKSNKVEREINVNFSNALYLCRNSQCNRKFFRVYQILEQMKYGVGPIENYKSISLQGELKLVTTNSIASFEKSTKLICPTCQMSDVISTKEFDWMKDAPDFPKLSYSGLSEFRKEFENRKISGLSRIKELEKVIEEKESLEAFQWQYKLDSSFSTKEKAFDTQRHEIEHQITNMRKEIISQLITIQENTPFLNEKSQIANLIKRVATTAEERYKKIERFEEII